MTPTFGEFWRERLQPASYNGVVFHMDSQSRTSGRRIAMHEFPKKDIPYAEDMGRGARRFPVRGYVIGKEYTIIRDDLVRELETEGPGQLILPTQLNADVLLVVPMFPYTVIEHRERGGFAEFEMNFVEFGQDTWSVGQTDTKSAVSTSAKSAIAQAQSSAAAVVAR